MILSENAEEVLRRRYYLKDDNGKPIEDAEAMFRRVAYAVAQGEPDQSARGEMEERFYDLMACLKFLPNSPTLMNAGKPGGGQLSACFVLPVGDSIEGIFDAVKHAAMIHKSGGGTGFSFSRLRPKGARVGSTGGVASGPVSFMKIFNTATEQIKQGGTRRGANMGILRVDHPDILDFISCKDDTAELTNFNLSVGLTDAFMDAVRDGTPFQLLNPADGSPVRAVDARELWTAITEHAWRTGEPGIIFLDEVNRHNPTPEIAIEATNPCLHGDMRIMTDRGYRRIADCVGETVTIWNGHEWSSVEPRITGHHQKMLRISFCNGSQIVCTPYHAFVMENGERVEAKDLSIGSAIADFTMPIIVGTDDPTPGDEMWCRGFYAGDGQKPNRSKCDEVCAALYGKKKKLLAKFASFWTRKPYVFPERDAIVVTLRKTMAWDKTFVPDSSFSIIDRIHYLEGLIDADGARSARSGGIAIASVDKEFLGRVRDLINGLGVKATMSIMKEEMEKAMPNGKGGLKMYHARACYRLSFSPCNVKALAENFGFHPERVDIACDPNRDNRRKIRVSKIDACDDADTVYCLTEPKRHTVVVEGVMIGQCGEQPLLPYEACNLGSINLAKFVDPGAMSFDWLDLGDAVDTAIDFLDDVVEISEFPLPQITERVRSTRKIGLGVMGWADALYKLGIPYGCQEAVDLAKRVMEYIQTRAQRRSTDRAAMYGSFPAVDKSVFAGKMGSLLPRNATVTTIAPTGTLSIIADCSSGIEPIFALSMTKHVMGGVDLPVINRAFKQYAQEYLEEGSDEYESVVEQVMRTGSCQGCDEVPQMFKDIFVTAQDIAPEWHLRMQAAFQKYTDNAVSKTVNLPNTATVADVETIYRQAYDLKLKGVTVYRDGCRAGQTLTRETAPAKQEPPKAEPQHDDWTPVDRPDVLSGATARLRTGLGTMFVTVNELDGKPYEVFATIGKCGHSIMAKTEAIGRLVSIALQHGVGVDEIIHQLGGIGGDHAMFRQGGMVLSVPDGIAKVLAERYMTDKSGHAKDAAPDLDDGKGTDEACPECGATLVHEDGCAHCQQCGWSRCA